MRSVWILFSDRPVRRWSEERKAAVRRRNLEKRINRHAPLFADELIARELAERPDYFQGKVSVVSAGIWAMMCPELEAFCLMT